MQANQRKTQGLSQVLIKTNASQASSKADKQAMQGLDEGLYTIVTIVTIDIQV